MNIKQIIYGLWSKQEMKSYKTWNMDNKFTLIQILYRDCIKLRRKLTTASLKNLKIFETVFFYLRGQILWFLWKTRCIDLLAHKRGVAYWENCGTSVKGKSGKSRFPLIYSITGNSLKFHQVFIPKRQEREPKSPQMSRVQMTFWCCYITVALTIQCSCIQSRVYIQEITIEWSCSITALW